MTQDERQTIREGVEEILFYAVSDGYIRRAAQQIKAILDAESAPPQAAKELIVRHGVGYCEKVNHLNLPGYLHGEKDNTPYNVDGVFYCGRCHEYIAARLAERAPRCGYDMGGECAVDQDGRAPSPSGDQLADNIIELLTADDCEMMDGENGVELVTTHHAMKALRPDLIALLSSPPSARYACETCGSIAICQESTKAQAKQYGCEEWVMRPTATPPSTEAKL
jgi:hypothetical protein